MKSRIIEFLLPLAAEGVKERKLSIERAIGFSKPIKMKATTTCAAIGADEGDVLHLHDDDKEIVTFTLPAGMPDRFDLSVKVGKPCHNVTDAPVTPPSGEQRVQDPVAIVQQVQVQVVKSTPPQSSQKPIEEMSTAEKLAAGLKPSRQGDKVVWS